MTQVTRPPAIGRDFWRKLTVSRSGRQFDAGDDAIPSIDRHRLTEPAAISAIVQSRRTTTN
jgi:hypothetical protein